MNEGILILKLKSAKYGCFLGEICSALLKKKPTQNNSPPHVGFWRGDGESSTLFRLGPESCRRAALTCSEISSRSVSTEEGSHTLVVVAGLVDVFGS